MISLDAFILELNELEADTLFLDKLAAALIGHKNDINTQHTGGRFKQTNVEHGVDKNIPGRFDAFLHPSRHRPAGDRLVRNDGGFEIVDERELRHFNMYLRVRLDFARQRGSRVGFGWR